MTFSNLGHYPFNLLITFCNRERHHKAKWGEVVPQEHRLTDEDITEFVMILKPIAAEAMYGKTLTLATGTVLKNLATLRPKLILPFLIQKLFDCVETLTEPHKFISCMQAMIEVARSMVIFI